MPWTDPTTRSTGDLITAAIWNTDVVDNLDYLYDNAFKGVYDSGWFAVTTATTYAKAHGMGLTPRMVVLLHSAVAAPGAGDEVVTVVQIVDGASNYRGAVGGADSTSVYVQTGSHASQGTVSSIRRLSGSGYYRVLAFK